MVISTEKLDSLWLSFNAISAVQYSYFLWAFASHPQMEESLFSRMGWLCLGTVEHNQSLCKFVQV